MKYDIKRVKHIDQLRKLRYPKNKMLIIGSGIMALMGIKNNDDIDIWTTPDIHKRMENDRMLVKTVKHGDVIYETKDGNIEIGMNLPCTKGPLSGYLKRAVTVSGYKFMSIQDLLKWKQCMGRPKDKIAIKQIQNYLRSSVNESIVHLFLEYLGAENDNFYIGKSDIHGKGVHAKKWLDKDVKVGTVTDPYPKITPMGSKLNHSYKPNCHLPDKNGSHHLLTTRPVEQDEELTVDYSKYDEFGDPDPSWS